MTFSLSDLRIDTEAESAGAWIGDIPDMPLLKLYARGWHCPQAEALLLRLARQGVPLPEAETRVLREVILLDWRGLTDGGVAVPFSAEMAAHLLTDPEFRLFRAAVRWAAEQVGRSPRMRSAG